MRRALAAVAVLLSGAAVAADRDPLAGRVAGAPQTCIDAGVFNQGPQIVDDQTILYRDGARIWRTGPRGACPALRPMSTLIVQVFGGRICRNDRFQLLQSGTSIPSIPCQFSEFTPYDKAK